MSGSDRSGASEGGLGLPPTTVPPPSVRAAILARVVQQTVGGAETPLLDGRYRLLREIGRGGAGTVWKAELLPLGRRVAVKLLRPGVASNPHAVSRLMREAMTVSQLGHEHIVQVNDVGTDEHGSPYIAMELLEGESLSQLVGRCGRLPWPEVAQIAAQLCDALSAAHAVGIVHRDVKPANVVAMRRDDGRWRCKLLDFGLCTAGRDTPMLTAAGVLLGTPGYAAPEQVRGETVDGRADLYGLACVMVELLTGRPAFRGGSRQEVVSHQLAGKRCRDLERQDIPEEVVGLLDRGLSPFPKERYADPAAFAEAIVSARAIERPQVPAADPAPRRRLGWGSLLGGAGMLAGASMAAVVAMLSWSSNTVEPAAARPSSRRPASVPRVRVELPAVAPVPARAELAAPSTPSVRKSIALPAAEATPSPAPVKRVRRRAPKPPPRAEPEPEPASPRTEYPHGIRDPFAAR